MRAHFAHIQVLCQSGQADADNTLAHVFNWFNRKERSFSLLPNVFELRIEV